MLQLDRPGRDWIAIAVAGVGGTAVTLVMTALTLAAYQVALLIHQRAGRHPVANPVVLSVLLIVPVLLVTRTPYETYFEGARFVHFVLGPATVAFAVPLYGQRARLRTLLMPLTTGGIVSLTALAVTLTGVSGAMMAPGLWRIRGGVLDPGDGAQRRRDRGAAALLAGLLGGR